MEPTTQAMKGSQEPVVRWRADDERGPVRVEVYPDDEGRFCSGALHTVRDSEGEEVFENTHFESREAAWEVVIENAEAGAKLWTGLARRARKRWEEALEEKKRSEKRLEQFKRRRAES